MHAVSSLFFEQVKQVILHFSSIEASMQFDGGYVFSKKAELLIQDKHLFALLFIEH